MNYKDILILGREVELGGFEVFDGVKRDLLF